VDDDAYCIGKNMPKRLDGTRWARATLSSICRFCHANCGILVEVEDGRPVRVTGDRANPAYHGFTCAKGRQLPAQHAHPERLLHSQKRAAPSRFEAIARVSARSTR